MRYSSMTGRRRHRRPPRWWRWYRRPAPDGDHVGPCAVVETRSGARTRWPPGTPPGSRRGARHTSEASGCRTRPTHHRPRTSARARRPGRQHGSTRTTCCPASRQTAQTQPGTPRRPASQCLSPPPPLTVGPRLEVDLFARKRAQTSQPLRSGCRPRTGHARR